MDKDNSDKKDSIRTYMNPDKIEKAPFGFTERLMEELKHEQVTSPANRIFRKGIRIPAVSLIITGILFALAYFLVSPDEMSLTPDFFKTIQNLELNLPEIDFDFLTSAPLPSLLFCLVIGVFILTLFDRVLSRLFRR